MSEQKTNKAMNIGLWIVQVLLGLSFIMAGVMKATMSMEELIESLPWTADSSNGLVRFIGISELLGGIGMLLPSILRIKPNLTVWAAYGLGVIMILATGFHASRGEFGAIVPNVIILALVLFVTWGRSKKVVILSKN